MTTNEKALKLHEEWNGKLTTEPKCTIASREDLALAYTPGVAEPCKVIAEDKEAAYKYTIKSNTIAVVSDGSAVLGLGNIGPYAAMPVMEGKAVLFKSFGDVNAFPICLDTQDTEEIIKTVVNIIKLIVNRNTSFGVAICSIFDREPIQKTIYELQLKLSKCESVINEEMLGEMEDWR